MFFPTVLLPRRTSRTVTGIFLILVLSVSSIARPSEAPPATAPFTGPWNLDQLKQTPNCTWGETTDLVREVYYDGEPYQGKPTRVFAYYGRPKEGNGPFPTMLLVHGGGGTAFAEWATLWAQRGYVALAMDLAGCGPERKRLADGGPNQSHTEKFAEFTDEAYGDMWTYHAIAAVIRGHSLLASLDEVDAKRIGVTGISWGGYLTSIVAGVDDRLKVAVPVYGCGFLQENSAWLSTFDTMTPALRDRWVRFFDPSRYLPGVRCPILFVNGTNDFAYPLDSYQKSYRSVPGQRKLCVTVRMPHSHPAGWRPIEIGLFVDSILKDGKPLPTLGPMKIEDDAVTASFESQTQIAGAQLHYTLDSGEWKTRNWTSAEAAIDGNAVTAQLPGQRPTVCFITIKDERGATVSTEHAALAD
ncbi:MAG: alpha/beta fold hydrolase [Planctomycetes bacterium]|nr:alpha/beta fold hydrolase [Planctomycetota bacterium]MBL7038226.1 alpha/beta fold hydrolase [Pirellulaceae bacterium]